jgi:small subunit ribosomal protein S20
VANHKSAEKRARQNERRRDRNRQARSRLRTLEKEFHTALEGGKVDEGAAQLQTVEGALRRAAARGLMPKRRASRRVSRLAKQLNKAGKAKA